MLFYIKIIEVDDYYEYKYVLDGNKKQKL